MSRRHDQVPRDGLEAKIPPQAAWHRFNGIGRSDELAHRSHGVESLDRHHNDWSGSDVVNQMVVKRLVLMFCVVLSCSLDI